MVSVSLRFLRLVAPVAVLVIGLSSSYAEVLELEGTVKSIDADTRAITIVRKTPKGEKVLDLEVAKKAGDLSGVKAGDSISFTYDPDLEVVTKIVEETKQVEKMSAAGDDALARPYLDKMLKGVEENDYDSFVADATADYKATVTTKIVSDLSGRLATRMKKGYDVIFLAELKQRGQKAYLWKLTFKDDGADWTVKVWLKDSKVTGSWWQ